MMECSCADEDCEHKKQKSPQYAFASGFKGTQKDYQQQQEKIKELNEWGEIFDMLELEDAKLKNKPIINGESVGIRK